MEVNTKTLLQIRIPVQREDDLCGNKTPTGTGGILGFLLRRSISDHAWYASSATSSTITKTLALTVAGRDLDRESPFGCLRSLHLLLSRLGSDAGGSSGSYFPRQTAENCITYLPARCASRLWTVVELPQELGRGSQPLSRLNLGPFFFLPWKRIRGISCDFHLPSQPQPLSPTAWRG